jgi:hypothetical protein
MPVQSSCCLDAGPDVRVHRSETHEKLPTTGQMCKYMAAGCKRQIEQLVAAALTMSTECVPANGGQRSPD